MAVLCNDNEVYNEHPIFVLKTLIHISLTLTFSPGTLPAQDITVKCSWFAMYSESVHSILCRFMS